MWLLSSIRIFTKTFLVAFWLLGQISNTCNLKAGRFIAAHAIEVPVLVWWEAWRRAWLWGKLLTLWQPWSRQPRAELGREVLLSSSPGPWVSSPDQTPPPDTQSGTAPSNPGTFQTRGASGAILYINHNIPVKLRSSFKYHVCSLLKVYLCIDKNMSIISLPQIDWGCATEKWIQMLFCWYLAVPHA